MPYSLVAAAVFHDRSKTLFFVAAGVLIAWAIIVSGAGIRSTRFPSSPAQGRMLMAISAVLVLFAGSMAVVTAKTPPPTPHFNTGAITNGVAPQVTPVSAAPTNGPVKLAADPKGGLSFDAKTLSAASSHVTIDFTNRSPVAHNLTIANAGGKVLGATATFNGGTKALTLDLPAGTYTFYCSVPGHEQAGMKGTLTVP